MRTLPLPYPLTFHFSKNMKPKNYSYLVLPLAALLTTHVSASTTIISTDFEGTTENGTTLENVSYITNGATVPASFSDLSVNNTTTNGSGNLITTAAADGFFAVANNTGNGGEWNFQIDFTTGADAIDLEGFVFDWRNFNGSGGFQGAIRDTEITIDIRDAGMSSVISGPIVQNTPNINTNTGATPGGVPPGVPGTQTNSIDLIGNTLAANTTFTLFVQAGDATTDGNNFGFDAITLSGTIVPEPSSSLLLGLSGLALLARRRRA